MPAEYTVRHIVGQNEWEGKHGKFRDYELALDGADAPNATVTLTQKPETAAPTEGQTIYGHIEETGRGPKLKKDQRDSQNGSQPGQDEFARRPDHPENSARARHSTSLGAAPAYYELLRTEGVLDKAESKEKALETLKGLIRWLEDTYPQPDDQLPFS